MSQTRGSEEFLITGERGSAGQVLLNYFRRKGHSIASLDFNRPTSAKRIFHLAARLPGRSTEDMMSSNLDYLREVIRYVQVNEVEEFIFFSSASVYGNPDASDVKEDSPVLVRDSYSATKYLGECLLKESGIKTLVLRLPAVLGAGIGEHLFGRWLTKLRENQEINLVNYGRKFNNVVSAETICQFLETVKLTQQFDVINLACEQDHSLLDLLSQMKENAGSASKFNFSQHSSPFFGLNIEKAVGTYGLRPVSGNTTIDDWLSQVSPES